MNPLALDCPAPAKLNLFLHVTGRRPDGYHDLQSVFQLIDLADSLDFSVRDDAEVRQLDPLHGVPPDHDLTVRAARRLQNEARRRGLPVRGVDLRLVKRIPIGGGLGGGSSDAATTLIVLNRLWKIGLTRAELMAIGLELGADVPFFVFGANAWAEGVGEQLREIALPDRCFAVIYPGVQVPTATIFGAPELTRNTKPIKISDFSATLKHAGTLYGHNDLEPVAARHFPPVARALQWLARHGAARMSGSGACVFGVLPDAAAAHQVLTGLPAGWKGWVCRSRAQHPLRDWVNDGPGATAMSVAAPA